MVTRIRQIRKLRGFTLQKLADMVGTTPQTIQRLETNNMTVSVEWLERIGKAFDMNPATLLTSYVCPRVPLIGELVVDGSIRRHSGEALRQIEINLPVEDPVAISLRDRFGPHEAGTILIANRLDKPKSRESDGRDCVVELTNGTLIFRRVVQGRSGTTAFVPYEDSSNVERDLDIAWLAPVVMALRYIQGA